ncbi:unnamed protein product [marine sediment metagenome]|uniref:Uncharacterized protein n=1 Tax=marine sediment metagenome TaxID=412755 RepID=X1QXK9_9ZZZZ
MAEIPKDLKPLLFGKGPRWHARSMRVLNWLGLACLIVGIVGDATNTVPGLEPTNWLIMAAALWLWGLGAWLAAYFAAKEG